MLFEKYPGWSPYNYTLENPINAFDPDGRSTISVGGSAFVQIHGFAGQAAIGVIIDFNGNIGIELTVSYLPVELGKFYGWGIGYATGYYFKFTTADRIYTTAGYGGTAGLFGGVGLGGALEFNDYLTNATSASGVEYYKRAAWGITGGFGAVGIGIYGFKDYTVIAGASLKQAGLIAYHMSIGSYFIINSDGKLIIITRDGKVIDSGITFQKDWVVVSDEGEGKNNKNNKSGNSDSKTKKNKKNRTRPSFIGDDWWERYDPSKH